MIPHGRAGLTAQVLENHHCCRAFQLMLHSEIQVWWRGLGDGRSCQFSISLFLKLGACVSLIRLGGGGGTGGGGSC